MEEGKGSKIRNKFKLSLEKAKKFYIAEAVLVLLCLISLAYDSYTYWKLREENISLKNEISNLAEKFYLSQKDLEAIRKEKEEVLVSLNLEKENTNLFANQLKDIAGSVSILEKIKRTDPELLKKYSKVYFLNENYSPNNLVLIDSHYTYPSGKSMQILGQVWPKLKALVDDAKGDGIDILIISAYRSFGTQATLKSTYKITYGEGTANKFSAEQGYSEHQLGTTVDFTTPTLGGNFSGFEKTSASLWLSQNAHRYGFTLSYPKENTFYAFEPWHFRYVGVGLATKLYDDGLYFYALDQREIDKYIANFFD